MREIDLYVTERCNLKCHFCSICSNRYSKEPSLDDIKNIVKQLKILKVESVHITGGEPFLREDLEALVEIVLEAGFDTRLITNGTCITFDRLKKLHKIGLRELMISLDGTQNYHDNIRGVGNYQKTLNAINIAKKIGFKIRVNSVAWKDNMFQIIENIRRFNTIDIYSVFLGSPLGYGKGKENMVVSPQEWERFKENLRVEAMKNDSMSIICEVGYVCVNDREFVNSFETGFGCGRFNKSEDFFLIRADGSMYPCVFFSNEGKAIGNVYDKPIKKIIKDYHDNRFYYECGHVLPAVCTGCDMKKVCKGGCRGYAKLVNNDWNDRDGRCNGDTEKKYWPICPIIKTNLTTCKNGLTSDHVK